MTGDEKYYCEGCQVKQEATRCCKLRSVGLHCWDRFCSTFLAVVQFQDFLQQFRIRVLLLIAGVGMFINLGLQISCKFQCFTCEYVYILIFEIDLRFRVKKRLFYILKVLSRELDQAESRLIPQNFIKGNVAAGFQKNLPAPHRERALFSKGAISYSNCPLWANAQ